MLRIRNIIRLTLAVCLGLALTMASIAGGSAAASKPDRSGASKQAVATGYVPKRTVVQLKKPIRFSRLVESAGTVRTDKSAGLDAIFEVKLLTDGGVGGFYPDGANPQVAIDKLARLNKRHGGARDPGIIEFTLTGSADRASLSPFAQDIKSVTIPQPNRTPVNRVTARSQLADYPGYWEPWRGVSQMIDYPDDSPYFQGREFRTAVGWDDRQALDWNYFQLTPTTPPDQFVIEMDLKLYNPQNAGDQRPNCPAGTNRQFWAAKSEQVDESKLSTGTVSYWVSDIPAAAEPYFDYADYDDPCTVQDLSWGVAKPQNLETDCETGACTEAPKYHMVIDTDDGLASGDTFSLAVQRLHNDCSPQTSIAPECISIPPAEPDEHTYNVTDTGEDYTPLCVGYTLDKTHNPPDTENGTFVYGGSNGVPGPDKWAQGTWRYGVPGEVEDFCGGGD